MTKKCGTCQETKTKDQFNKRTKSKDGLASLCRTCQNKRDLEAYRRAPQKTIMAVRARTVKNQEFVSRHKTSSGCADCGLQDPHGWMFDLDHRFGKIEDVSRMLSHSQEKIATEISKCDVVCSNCHRVRTYLRNHGTHEPCPPVKATKTPALMRMWKALFVFKSGPCLDCGGKFHFAAMDCDHRDPATKSGDPSNMARNGSEETLLRELAKCDSVCSNCHRKRTHKRTQSLRELESYVSSIASGPVPFKLVCVGLSEEAVSHAEQAKELARQGLGLLAIFEDEWKAKPDLIKAMIRHRLGILGTKYRASKLTLKKLTTNAQFEAFFARNHLDGHTKASYAYGLFDGDRLVSCMSVRTNHQGEREIARFATDYDCHVYGGAGRLVKAISAEEPVLYTFSNNRLSNGDVYQKLGFTFLKDNPPSYWYTDGKERVWRYKCKRINDPEFLAKFPEVPHTEKDQAREGLHSIGIWGDRRPLWKIEDYGHKKWVLDSRIKRA